MYKRMVLFLFISDWNVFSHRKISKGQGSQINPQRPICVLLLFFKFYRQEKLQEQDVSMIMKVSIKANAMNKECFFLILLENSKMARKGKKGKCSFLLRL